MVGVPEDFVEPPLPRTLVERVAWALCAHDLQGCEGRLEPVELRALEAVIEAIRRRYASPHALCDFLGMGGAATFNALRRFARDERALHDKERAESLAILYAHLIRADWPSYLRQAEAAVSVMLERPEAVAAWMEGS